MKSALLIALMTFMSVISYKGHAAPPPAIDHVVVCKDLNDLTEEEIVMLNDDQERIIYVDTNLRLICFK